MLLCEVLVVEMFLFKPIRSLVQTMANDKMYAIYKAKRLKIKMLKPNVFGCLPSSGLKMTVRTHAYIS